MRSASSTKRRAAAKKPKRAPDHRRELLLDPGRTCWTIGEARGGVIIDAADFYREIADAIDSARGYVLIGGWQIESSVWLRRRPDDEGRPRTLWGVIRAAAERARDLRFYVLAWDWASVYALDREWGTKELLEEAGLGRLAFVHDSAHAQGASQHEKLVVVDGHTAWVGGIDVCEHRWDERSHLERHPMRFDLARQLYGPYHDVAAVVRGKLVRDLVEHFVERWEAAGAEPMVLVPDREPDEEPGCHVPLGRAHVAISRTRGATVVPLRERVREIEALYARALRSAERLVYVESQYITARAIVHALVERMRAEDRPRLEIVVIVPQCLEGRMEKATIEGPQRVALTALRDVARRTGHALGVFSPCVPSAEDETGHRPTYVHTKLMIVDDRFLTIGSANATNRSMGLDSELNLSWHSVRAGDAVERGIRAVRVSLLTEHTGLAPRAAVRQLVPVEGLVDRLRRLTHAKEPRLLRFEFCGKQAHEQTLIDELLAELGDPDGASIAEEIFEEIVERPRGIVAKAVSALHELRGAKP